MANRYDFIPKHLHFKHNGKQLVLRQLTYDDGNAALIVEDINGRLHAKLSVNFPEIPLGKNEYIIKNYSENIGIAEDVYKQGWFDDTGIRVKTGFVEMPLWKWRTNE